MGILESIKSPHDLRNLSREQLPELAREVRAAIYAGVARSGGHLAPNLGVVELTIALHYVFDFAHDRLLFDVGHQCYPHKLLTGRLAMLENLRTREGMAGFPDPRESAYDLFGVGHAGTGISTGVGMARGDMLNGEAFDPRGNPGGRRVVTLVGDASIVNGVAMEGLNNAGTLPRQFLVILNDNGMSISKPQGAMARQFDRLRISNVYAEFKKQAKEALRHLPGGEWAERGAHRAGEMAKAMFSDADAGSWFEHFGLKTVGPIDGHDFDALLSFLREAREIDRPMVLHVKTVKGRGYSFSEQDSVRFHSPSAFSMVDGDPDSEDCRIELKSDGRSFTSAAGEALAEIMARDEKVVACTAAMPDGTGLSKVLTRFPDRAWDTGICESHAMDMMAGLARTGFRPFFAVYCTFLQRAFDQAFQEVSLQGLGVRLLLDRAGLVGGDGAVHHGFCDVALLRTLPGAVLMAAIDEPSLVAAMEFMRQHDAGLSAVRYPRDIVSTRLAGLACPPFEPGKARCLTPDLDVRRGGRPDAAVLAFGTPAIDALGAVDGLGERGRVAVYDARFAKPVDAGLVRSLLARSTPILTVEDHGVMGGFGSAVAEAAAEIMAGEPELAGSLHLTRLGLPDRFIRQDPRGAQLAEAGLDWAGLARSIREVLASRRASVEPTIAMAEARPSRV
ncbi:MAG: 1-deoxy-D-xylulose-5-phosphate synthase [Phycisphaerae bacterium]|nr:1-deoxy-D-xylulose-5-phosphate synthase [Phycisphaerae bacterium]